MMFVEAESLNTGNGTVIEIKWHEPECAGYVDIFPANLFGKQLTMDLEHQVRGPRGYRSLAKCRMHVHGRRVDLDYEVFPEFNTAAEMYLGVMQLHFSDRDRTSIKTVLWRDQGTTDYLKANVKIKSISLPLILPYTGPTHPASRVLRLIRERPGQMNFRRDLKYIYGSRCCLSGCPISETLEGAHIDRYEGPSSDHPQNGLLLRRDIHSLFDAGLLAIHPETGLAYLARRIQSWREYGSFHGAAQLRAPLADYSDRAPSRDALQRRWSSFSSRHGTT